jgi:hypothetical protein
METRLHSILIWLTLAVSVIGLPAQNTVVTYQGRVQTGGSDFTGPGQFKFALVTVTNKSSTATAVANPPSGGFITVITVTFGGNGYVTPPAVTITGGGGSGATATASLTGSAVSSITVNNTGSGYTSTPTVTVAPPPEALAYTTYWSNDGTSAEGSEPGDAISLPVNNGLFTARLGDASVANMTALPDGLFAQPDLHLRLWFDDGVNGFAVLHPTQPLSAAPYAFIAGGASNLLGTVTTANLSGTYSEPITFNNAANTFSGSGAGLTALNASQLTSGTVPAVALGNAWKISGNAGTSPGTHFLGTADNQALELKVNGIRALRLEPTAALDTANVIGGSARNAVGAGARGATIGGGGGTYLGIVRTNRVDANFATVGGGSENTIQSDAFAATLGGGWINTIQTNAQYATISGGFLNTIETNARNATIGGGQQNMIQPNALYATIGGGEVNTIQTNANRATIGGGNGNTIQLDAIHATIGGGNGNTIQTNAQFATIGGGLFNTIQPGAQSATIPGGRSNLATNYAFAAGYNAWATNTGAFVWSDGGGTITSSTNNNSVTMRARGGYRFFTSSGTTGAQLLAGATAWSVLSDRNLKKDVQPVDYQIVLDKLAQVPVKQWRYVWETESDPVNLGPMAQDFKAAFFPGRDDTSISTLEFDGVALAAIQGLNQKIESETAALRSENSELKQTVNELKKLVHAMNQQLNGGAK